MRRQAIEGVMKETRYRARLMSRWRPLRRPRSRASETEAPAHDAGSPQDVLAPEHVIRTYEALLGREPGPAEVEHHVATLTGLRDLLDVVLASDEFAARTKVKHDPPPGFVNVYHDDLSAWTHPVGLVSDDEVAIVGEQGMLFLRGGTNENLSQFLGEAELEPGWLEGWQTLLERRRTDAAAMGASFVGLVVPDKLAVYREAYPEPLIPVGPRPVERLVDAGVPVLYPLDQLRDARDLDDVYLRVDTHVSLWGNLVLYGAVLSALGEQPEPLLDRVEVVQQVRPGDLGARFCPTLVEIVKAVPSLGAATLREDNWPEISAVGGHIGTTRVFVNPTASDGRTLVMFGDSFGFGDAAYQGISWFLAQTFREVHFVWAPFGWDPGYAAEAAADVVVCQTAERFLRRVPLPAIDVAHLARETRRTRQGLDPALIFSGRP
jgi:hypothetical protein